MSPSPLSINRCTKGGTRSRRWIAVALAMALIGFGSAFAGTKRAAPVAGSKTGAAPVADDAVSPSTTLTGTRAPGSPNAPVNDDCPGALVIPDGPYPVVSPAVNGADATPQGSDDGGLFPTACNAQGTDFTVWYTFTPSVSTGYTFSTCPASGASAETVLDTVIAIFSSSDGTCAGAMTSLSCNDSGSCSSGGDRSVMSAVLNAGTTYYVVAGHWLPDTNMTAPNTTYQLVVTRSSAPANDTCAGAVTLQLNQFAHGTTVAANDDYQTPATAACYPGTQFPTTASGRDVVYTFTAPADGKYSARFRPYLLNSDTSGADVVLYAASNCPAGGGTVNCILGGNHLETAIGLNTSHGQNNNRGEELKCMPLTAGQQIWIFFDNSVGGASNPGGPFQVEVTPCVEEVEPNDTIATATPYSTAYCGTQEGSISTAPSFHCVLGPNNGLPCQATSPGTGVPTPVNCGGAPNQCFPDSVCESGPNLGQACVPRCVGGPTPGAICTQNVASTFCGTGGACQVNGQCGVCTSGSNSGQPCVNNANCGVGGVCAAGVCDRNNNEGDVDYWSLGTPAAGSKVYAGIWAAGSNDSNLRMRITNPTNTIGFDEDDATSLDGSLSSNISGAKADGTATYVKVSKTTPFVSDIYKLYSVVEPPVAQAQAEVGDEFDGGYGWPADGLFDTPINNGANAGYIKGTFFNANDQDCYKMFAHKGDDLLWFGDSNPDRTTFQPAQGPSVPQAILYDAIGAGPVNFVFTTDTVYRNIGPAFTPGQNGIFPRINSFFMHWRMEYTGSFELCIYPFAVGTFGTSPGPFPAPYTVAATVNCAPMANAGAGTTTTDVAITKYGPAGPIPTSGPATFTITISNLGSDLAQDVTLNDVLPSSLRYISAQIDDGFGGKNTACLSVPTPGTADAPLNCTTMSIEAGASVTYTLNVQVADCIGGGVDVTNTATVSTSSTDPNSANNSASASFTTSENNNCTILVCDANGCQNDQCFLPGTCNAGSCVAPTRNCDDNNLCTADSCNPTLPNGCINDPTPGQQCDDGNACTGDATGHDSCDPATGCVFAPAPAGTSCNDFFNCTNNDICDGNGNCAGTSVCDDHNVCTDDFADEFNNCACSNTPNLGPCNDGNACTDGDTCDAQGVCQPGTGVTNCDDGDACTADSCDPATGCHHTPITCDDGNACTVDTCNSADGCHYTDNSAACNDGNACTTDTCNPASGCVYTNNNNACDDGNACTTGDACSGGSCHGGAPVVCNDNNVCTDDSCDPSSGCIYTPNTAPCSDGNACTNGDVCGGGSCHAGAPTVCTASDQCHVAGTCDTGTGACSNPAAPNGTTCDDGNPNTTGDACQGGVCTGTAIPNCPTTPDPKTASYYKKLCGNGNHGSDSITNADAQCVGSSTATFAGISTASQVCSVLASGGGQDACSKDEDELMALALNICRNRVCKAEEIDSNCGLNTKTVGQSFSAADGIFANPVRDSNSCNVGACLGREINNGRALKLNSLNLSIQGGSVKLIWAPSRLDDGTVTPSGYTIWRRPAGSTQEFKLVGKSVLPMYVDRNAKSLTAFEYRVVPVAP